MIKQGLLKLKKDIRDLKLGAIIQLPKLEELPSEFIIEPLSIKNQIDFQGTNTDSCTGFATCGASELQEGVELCPEYTFALTKIGNLDSWGANLRDACKTHIKYGALEKKESPYSYENKSADFLRDINNWPELKDLAIKHKKNSYVSIDGPYDYFDTLKSTIWYYRNEKRLPMIGLLWNWNLSDVFLEKRLNKGFGHALYVIGWKNDWLIVQNSYSRLAGENGRHYISREVINKGVDDYGAFMFIDATAEDLKKLSWNFYQRIIDLFKKWFEELKKEVDELPKRDIEDVIIEEAIKTPEPKYKWDTKENSRHSCRVIMDEYNLLWKEKDLLCAVIQAESNFDIKAVNDITKDYGICQINEKWWIGEGKYFSSIEEVLTQPEKSVKFMIEQYKKGRLDYWIAYKNGSYKRYL